MTESKSLERRFYVEPWDSREENKFIVFDRSMWDQTKMNRVIKFLHSAAYGRKAIVWYCAIDYKTKEEALNAAARGNSYWGNIFGEDCDNFIVLEVDCENI